MVNLFILLQLKWL
jgi:hypothetical protein